MASDSARSSALGEAVTLDFYQHQFIANVTPFLDALRGTSEFDHILVIAERRVQEFRA